ncbi:unnamed protein product, partial [Fusarium graminearum]
MDREEYNKQNDAANDSEEHDNISLFFFNLKAACGIDENLRRKQACQQYFAVLKEASSLKINWADWITRWEKSITLAKLRNIEKGTYSPLVFSAHFRQEVQDGKVKTEKEKPARIAKGSFGPTFRASSSESTKRTLSGPPLSRENSAKRPRQSIESGEKGECKLYEKSHKKPNTTSCWVAFPEGAPQKLTPS